MFEMIRRPTEFSPVREMLNVFANDPFFRMSVTPFDDEGNLPLDIVEERNDLVVRASLPGFKKDDIEVQIENGVLSINARRMEESETKDEKYYRRERRVGSVSRRIALPGVISDAKAEATLENGELCVRIPKAEVARPKQITVK